MSATKDLRDVDDSIRKFKCRDLGLVSAAAFQTDDSLRQRLYFAFYGDLGFLRAFGRGGFDFENMLVLAKREFVAKSRWR